MKHTPIYLLLSLLLAGCAVKDETTITYDNGARPNIIFMIADDWSFPHAGAYGARIVQTPAFDRLAGEGALFQNAFCAAPSCSPSRAAILTGRFPHQLESAGNLWPIIPVHFPNWVSMLEDAGYFTGKSRKGWGPGDAERGGYEHNPAGPSFENFGHFLAERPKNQPFCFWFGSYDPHRPYEANMGIRSGMDLAEVAVPLFLPDMECIRNDILDYYFEVERFDRDCGDILRQLEDIGELDNTLIVMTSDNGMPFPRAKANLYDYGTRMPLAIYWKGKIAPGTVLADFVSFVDFAPTFLEAAGISVPASMSGRSLLPLLTGRNHKQDRSKVFIERERHANCRAGNRSYPMRAVRTKDFLYIRNLEPDLWPAGDPHTHQSVGQYGDEDNSITKFLIMDRERWGGAQEFYFQLAFGKRPAEELYKVSDDPFQLKNLAGQPAYLMQQNLLRAELDAWMRQTGDLRATDPHTSYWDEVEYTAIYQNYDFDLEAEINKYIFLKPNQWAQYVETPCRQ